MRLTTVGRRSGKERSVILGYYEDGPNLVTMAMNGWKDAEPAWWLNLQANPEATIELPGGQRRVTRNPFPQRRPGRLHSRSHMLSVVTFTRVPSTNTFSFASTETVQDALPPSSKWNVSR